MFPGWEAEVLRYSRYLLERKLQYIFISYLTPLCTVHNYMIPSVVFHQLVTVSEGNFRDIVYLSDYE